jgi:hypothetical protein
MERARGLRKAGLASGERNDPMRKALLLLLVASSLLVACKDDSSARQVASTSAAPSASSPPKAPEPPPEQPHERTVVAHFKKPKALAVEGTHVFVLDAISGDKAQNELLDVFRVSLADDKHEPVRIASKQRAASTPVLFKGDLFFTVAGDTPAVPDRVVKLGSGGAVTTVAPKALSQADPAVATDGNSLFYFAPGESEKTMEVMRVPLAGGKPEKLATGDRTAKLLFIAADAKNVYFPEAGRIVRVPVAGGAPTELAKVVYAWAAASDGTHLYWADSPGDNQGMIRRAPIAGGAPDTLASGFSYPVSMSLDAKSVYFINYDAEDGVVYRVAKTGGTAVALLHGQKNVKRIALDATNAYFINVGEGTLARIAK